MNRAFRRLSTIRHAFAIHRNVLPTNVWSVRPMAGALSTDKITVPFLDNENFSAHNSMVNDPAYRDTIINPQAQDDWPTVTDKQFNDLVTQDFGQRTVHQVCNDFMQISMYVAGKDFELTDSIFDGFRDRLKATLPEMTDEQLLSVFRLIPLWNMINAKNPVYYDLWSQFDNQCILRYKSWSLNKLLLVMDHWYIMKLSRLSNFVWMGVRKLARKPSRLTPRQLVQMMFYANTSRKFLPTLPMFEIEQELCAYYNDFNIKELGIISLGFFKTQTPIRNQQLVKNLYISVINETKNISSIELAALLKLFRYCTKPQNADSMYKLMDALIEKVDEVQLICCTHMALLGTNLLIRHEELLNKICQRIVKEISSARVKDLERITLALTMLNYNPRTTPCIFETIVNELQSDKRNIEFEEHSKCYIFTLSYLAVKNIFPYSCISKALKIETLHKCFGKKLSKFNIPRDVLCLNNSLLLECTDYSGPLLPNQLKESCNEYLSWIIPTTNDFTKKTHGDIIFSKIYNDLLQLFKNESFLHVCYPLPHLPKCDIIFCIDADGKPVTIPETMKNKIVFNDFHKPPALGKWFAVMILTRNSVLYYSGENNGLTVCKIRQLKKLDYEPILVNTNDLENNFDNKKLMFNKLKNYGIVLN